MLVFLQPPDLGIAHGQASTDATRPARADATNTGPSSTTLILETLITNIGNEQAACDTQYAADSKVRLGTHTAARVRFMTFIPLCLDRAPTMVCLDRLSARRPTWMG